MKLAAAVGVVAWIRVWLDLELEHFQQKLKEGLKSLITIYSRFSSFIFA